MMATLAVDWPLESLFNDTVGFVAMVIFVFFVIGMASTRMAIASLVATIPFIYIGSQVQGEPLITDLMYVTMVIVCLGLGFKFIRSEFWGE